MQASIVIPTYNSSSFVKSTLESVVAAADGCSYEIILVDDCSDDVVQLREIVSSFPQARLLEKEKKSNASVSRNMGIISSQGEYIFLLDSDDHFRPGYLLKRIEFMREKQCDLAFGAYYNVYEDFRDPFVEPPSSGSARDYLFKEHKDFRTSTISFRGDLKNDFLFNPDLNKHQDWGFFIENTEKTSRWAYDQNIGVELHVSRDYRMSSSMDLEASENFLARYLTDEHHITGFCSRLFWLSIIGNDKHAYHFFSKRMKLAHLDTRAKAAKLVGDAAYEMNLFTPYHHLMCQVKKLLSKKDREKTDK